MDKTIYEKTIQKQRRDRTVTIVCVNCGEDDPTVIEEHHVFGRNNSDEKISLCKNCHAKITKEQNKVPPKARSPSASPREKLGFILISQGALQKISGETLVDLGHEMIHRE